MTTCKANMVIASSKNAVPNKPIAIIVLSAPADVRTYNTFGSAVGVLPAGSYLVMSVPTATNDGGTPTVLFLVGLNGNNYLIPSTVVQGFGAGAIGDTGQAGIRDGFVRYRLFGW
jgi:hypothetical protein